MKSLSYAYIVTKKHFKRGPHMSSGTNGIGGGTTSIFTDSDLDIFAKIIGQSEAQVFEVFDKAIRSYLSADVTDERRLVVSKNGSLKYKEIGLFTKILAFFNLGKAAPATVRKYVKQNVKTIFNGTKGIRKYNTRLQEEQSCFCQVKPIKSFQVTGTRPLPTPPIR